MSQKESGEIDLEGERTTSRALGPSLRTVESGKVARLSLQQSGSGLRLQHLSAATGLILTYLIEIGVQIFLISHCWSSLASLGWKEWDWPSSLILSSAITSLLVTTMSMAWVCRSLDFVGRVCARLLCYVMHFCLLGLLWRYLKLAFAYDHADVQEFVALRIFQVYIQSLPLTSLHLAWLITFREEWFGLAFWIIMVELASVATSLVISAYVKSESKTPASKALYDQKLPGNPSRTTQVFSDSLKCPAGSERTGSVMWSQVLSIELNILSRVMLLVCRLLVLAILVAYVQPWTIVFIFLIHSLISGTWIAGIEQRRSNSTDEEIVPGEEFLEFSTKEFFLYVLESSYIIFWDITSSLQGPMRLSAWALPSFLVIFENGAIMILYSYEVENAQLLIILICTACLILGFGLFTFLNFVTPSPQFNCCTIFEVSSSFNSKKDGGVSAMTSASSFTPTPSVSPMDADDFCYLDEDCCWNEEEKTGGNGLTIMSSTGGKISVTNRSGSSRRENVGSWDTRLGALQAGKPLIMANNYTNISEVLMSARVQLQGSSQKRRKSNLAPKGSTPKGRDNSSPSIPWVPDTCCNDSNGSSNSRNTNTLLEAKEVEEVGQNKEDVVVDDMILDNPSFIFYFPEQPAHKHHSTVRKLNLQSVAAEPKGSWVKGKRSTKSHSNTSSLHSGSVKAVGRTSTPVEIRKAARVIMNYPKHNHHHHRERMTTTTKSGSRCHCHSRETTMRDGKFPDAVDPGGDPFYEKLMEDSYGILICEGETALGTHSHSNPKRNPVQTRNEDLYSRDKSTKLLPSIYPVNQKLKVLCAKCLRNHDPLLTSCLEEEEEFPSRLEPGVSVQYPPRVPPIRNAMAPPIPAPSDTTEYPSETEMTWTAAGDEQLSVVSSHLSTATYTTWPRKGPPHLSMSMWTATSSATPYPKEFTSREYVRTWLLTSQARAKHYYNEYGNGGSALKKIHRSRTISTGAGGAVSRSSNHARPGSSHYHAHTYSPAAHAHKSLGKRHGPIGRGQSPQSLKALSIPPSLTLAPPPKQKQHPVLPPTWRLEISSARGHHDRSNTKCKIRSRSSTQEFYKDLEIIV